MNLIDIHAHLNFPDYDTDREAVIKRTVEAGCGVINVGADLKTSREVVTLANNKNFWAAVGLHPHAADNCEGSTFAELEELARHQKVVAIGECGLDYFRLTDGAEEKKKQFELFEQQIELALKLGKPVMIHCREAYEDVLAILKKFSKARGNVHFFSGTIAQAKQFLDLGFTLSFTGVITFTHDYDEAIKFIPLDRLMAETDAPFVAPAPYRGQRNEPLYVREVIKRLAELKGLSTETMNEQLVANTIKIFACLSVGRI